MMYCYFSSAYPAAIKINGLILGRADGDARGIRIDEESVYIDVCPLDFSPASGFILDKDFLAAPPPFISVTDLKGGYLIRIAERIKTVGFKLLEQKKYPDVAITVFSDTGIKASIETPQGFLSDFFPFNCTAAEVSRVAVSGKPVALIFFPEKSAMYLYDVSAAPVKLGEIPADSFNADFGLTTEFNKRDIAKRKIKSEWEIKDGKLFESAKTFSVSERFDKAALPAALIPYAFFEELSAGGDYGYYLSETVRKNADKLKEYFGEFLSIMPPPPFRDVNEIGLIYKASENKYYVDYATVETENGKITNLKRSET